MKAYKICGRKDDGLVSMAARGRFSRGYAIGKTTTPVPGTDWLMAFDTLENAILGMEVCGDDDNEFAILECEVEPYTGESAHNIKISWSPEENSIRRFWSRDWKVGGGLGIYPTYEGTIFVTKCKPLREVPLG